MVARGNLLTVVGWIVLIVSGLWGFSLCLAIIVKVAGFWGLVAALFLSPVTFAAAPLYAGFAWGDWFPLVLNYGGGIAALILIGIGEAMSGKHRDKKSVSSDGRMVDALKQIVADGESAGKIIGVYGSVLELVSHETLGAPESLLPRSKEEIKQAIKAYLLYSHVSKTLDEKYFSTLETGYAMLSHFMNDADARNATAYQDWLNYAVKASSQGEDMAEVAKRLPQAIFAAALARYDQSQREFKMLMYEYNAVAKQIGISYAKTAGQIDKSIAEAETLLNAFTAGRPPSSS